MILVVGLSHRTAPVQIRERLAAGAEALPAVLARLASREELAEAMFLSTCNRVEVIALAHGEAGIDEARRAICEELAAHGGATSGEELVPYLYEKRGDEAVRHIFRVAASLDSMVLGEPQILGQVKDAYEAAAGAGTLSGLLARCMSRAFAVAKRVRTETAIGAGSVSISSVAVDLARRIFGDLADRTVLLLGAGEMAEAAARSLVKGARALRICNRNFDRAAALASELHAAAVPWDDLGEELTSADVVVASTASSTYVVTRDLVKRAMKARKGRTLLLVDIGVPRNIDPAAHGIDNVYVFNVDDLEQEVARGMQARQAQVTAAEAIVAEELAQFLSWRRALEVAPTLVAMRTKTRALFLAELERSLGGRLRHLTEGDRLALTQMLDSAVNKLLHTPTTKLKARAAEGDDAGELAAAVRFLFDLQEAVTAEPSRTATPTRPPASASADDEPLIN
ncbi:MAG TPA: glutamyl-tRNA reductase [Polyangiaceae bacterium]|jgi:glutamyl-tRNA reductase|nr:glutamyl-tRNA reductase [Polyangiaceae bacterium]